MLEIKSPIQKKIPKESARRWDMPGPIGPDKTDRLGFINSA